VADLPREDSEKDITATSPKRKRVTGSSKKMPLEDQVEKRPRIWRNKAPKTYTDRLWRAISQRMFVLDRKRDAVTILPTSSSPSLLVPSEDITVAGSTGNIYTVTISSIPSCTCPDARKGNQCKHIIYSLVQVLKAPPELQYQLSFLPSELEDIFAKAPLPSETLSADDKDADHPSNRKPVEDADCPICFCNMSKEEDETGALVWCKAVCGNNVHKACFAQWDKAQAGELVRCVFCRTPWQKEDVADLKGLRAKAIKSVDGYENVGAELGLNRYRDYSTYHRPWVSQRFRDGDYEEDGDY